MTVRVRDPNVKTVRDLLPIHMHPPAGAVRGIWRVAKQQKHKMWNALPPEWNTNQKAKFVREHLTPEQLYVYEWIAYMYVILALPYDTLARQIGCSKQTLRTWLKRSGHIPNRVSFYRLSEIYDTNFCDQEAADLLHGDRIGQWRERIKSGEEILKESGKKPVTSSKMTNYSINNQHAQ